MASSRVLLPVHHAAPLLSSPAPVPCWLSVCLSALLRPVAHGQRPADSAPSGDHEEGARRTHEGKHSDMPLPLDWGHWSPCWDKSVAFWFFDCGEFYSIFSCELLPVLAAVVAPEEIDARGRRKE
jgi:hypothetical protein